MERLRPEEPGRGFPKKDGTFMPEIQRGLKRCLTDQEKAEALAANFAFHFSLNCHNDPDRCISQGGFRGNQRNPQRKILGENDIPKRNADNDFQRHAPFHLLYLRVEICGNSPHSKIQEAPLHSSYYRSISLQGTVIDYQSGFRSDYSATLQFFMGYVTTIFNKKQSVVMLDQEKLFDKVRNGILLLKIKDYGFPASILKTIRFYL
ncbi:hypothetical protein Trydic_g11709 [Trypoxylus dichotomus]